MGKEDKISKDTLTLRINAGEKLANFISHKILHVPTEKNAREDVLSKLLSTITSGINHNFIKEIPGIPIIEILEVAIAIIENSSQFS